MQAIEIYAQPATADVAPLNRPTAVLTPRGPVAVTVLRLQGQVIALHAEDRAWIVELLRQVADDVAAV